MSDPIGTWRLVRVSAVDAGGTELTQPFGGEHAMGLLTLSPEGRMMAVLCDGNPEAPEQGPREYNSYCGSYQYDGKQLVTRVDACVKPHYFGSDQTRDVAFEGELMVLRPPLRPYGSRAEQRTLYWEKLSQSPA